MTLHAHAAAPSSFTSSSSDTRTSTRGLLPRVRASLDPMTLRYFAEIIAVPLLSPEEERALFARFAQGEQDARARLITANLRLVVSIASHYGRGAGDDAGFLPLLDHIQNGTLGLMRAIESFEVARGYKFSTYATWWIRQAILRGTDASARMIRLPSHVVSLLRTLDQAEDALAQQQGGRDPDPQQLAGALGLALETVTLCQQMRQRPLSLDWSLAGHGGEEATLGERIPDEDTPPPEETASRREQQRTITAALAALTTREREAITRRFGLSGHGEQNNAQIGRALGISRERARQLVERALTKLRANPVLCASMMEAHRPSGSGGRSVLP